MKTGKEQFYKKKKVIKLQDFSSRILRIVKGKIPRGFMLFMKINIYSITVFFSRHLIMI